MGQIVNQIELAKIFGKSIRTIKNWQSEGMPVKRHGARGKENQYDTEAVINWLLSRQAEKKQSEYFIERARLMRAQADKTEMDVRLLESVIIDARYIMPMWTGIVEHIRGGLQSFPCRLAPRLSQEDKHDEVEKILYTEVDDLLYALSNNPPQIKIENE